jgi:hypothetical protein
MEYEDLFEMFGAILDYVSSHPGCKIISADDPMSRRIGFTTSYLKNTWQYRLWDKPWVKWGLLGRLLPFLRPKRGKVEVWQISLVNVHNSMRKRGVTEETRSALREYFTTPMGRVALGQALSKGHNPCSLEVTPQ